MPRVRILDRSGQVLAEAELAAGAALAEAARAAGLPLPFGCLQARCGVCRVRLRAGSLAPPETLEALGLRSLAAPPEQRLACQARIGEGAVDLEAAGAAAAPRDGD